MKKSLSKKLIICLILVILITGIVFVVYKNTNIDKTQEVKYDEFKEYIEIIDTSNLVEFVEKTEENKIIYSKKVKLAEYVGDAKLIRNKIDNSYLSNEFEINLGEIDNKKIDDFLSTCQKYVTCENSQVSINIETSQDKKENNDISILESLKNNSTVRYVFQKETKLYMVTVYVKNSNLIATFSYNGEIPKVKLPHELTEEEKKKANEKFVTVPVEGENGVG